MNKVTDYTTDILIAGAGMVGSAMALAAASLGYQVVLLEPQPLLTKIPQRSNGISDFDLRVSALTKSSTRLLSQLGVWSELENDAQPYRRMDVWDNRGGGRIVFDADEVFQQDLGVIIENRRVTAALHQQINLTTNISMIPGRLQSCQEIAEGVELTTAAGQVLSCRLFLGVDGAHSVSRRLLALPTREWDYGQQAIVATVKTARPHQRIAYQQFLSSGPVALLPLKDAESTERYCSLVWSLDNDASISLQQATDDEFMQALSEASDYKSGVIEATSQRVSFPLRQRHAKHYIAYHAAVLGDAAHTIHPLAGQGVNLGFDDVSVLIDELTRAQARQINPGNREVLQRYQRRRQPANLAMMAAMESFKRGFGSDGKWLTWIRNQGLNRVNQALPLKKMLMKQAMGLQARDWCQ